MARAYSVSEILAKKYDIINWGDKWAEAFDKPESSGIWINCGNSGNGKSEYVMQLSRELALIDKVFFNALEEGTSLTLHNNLKRSGLGEVKRRVLFGEENIADMTIRMKKRKSPQFYIVDSIQYARLTWAKYVEFKKVVRGEGKLVIFNSHADGKKPRGKIATDVWYDADLKVWVEGYKAISNGRYNTGGEYTIWDEGANKYWGLKNSEQ